MAGRLDRFLTDCIDSAAQCEILAAMQASGTRWWAAADLARHLRRQAALTAEELEVLATRGLLEVRIASQMQYRLGPVSPDLAAAVAEFAEAYRASRVDVLSRIRTR